ncbi:MAG: ABC transporter substrate-binding protein [Spirochaetia bacterium]|nr:ABC transporter substrate-binding protein [Spirochaetia bacterium]
MKKTLALILAAVLSFSFLSGFVAAKEAVNKKMTIAFCTWTGYAPLFIAEEKGYFNDCGYNVELKIMEDESAYGEAFASGSIQALGQALDRDIIQYEAGAPEQYVCTMDCSAGGDGLIAASGIRNMDDLAGKTVALDKYATSYFLFLRALADSNITEDQINIVEMGNDEAGKAFLAGKVDAAVTWGSALVNCSSREGGHLLFSSADYPETIIDVLTVSSEFARENPEVSGVLYDCWCKAVDFLRDNFEEGCSIMADGLNLDVADVMEECSRITFYDRTMNEAFNDTSAENNVYDVGCLAASFWVRKGYMKSDDISGFFPMLNSR